MSVYATYDYACDGCEAKIAGDKRPVHREFTSVSGRSYGFGCFQVIYPKIMPPDGWIAFDPYTGCCYCPGCWEDIESGEADQCRQSKRQ